MRLRVPRRPRLTLAVAALLLGCGDVPSAPDDREPLLTDPELSTLPDGDLVAVDPEWDAWIRGNHHTLRSLTSTRTEDLQFLEPLIGSRRLVQLGASGHGVREFNLAKVRLVRFLHEEMGFDVLAFESELLDCWRANERLPDAQPHVAMSHCVSGVWSTQEVLELFAYIRATHDTPRPLILAGVDVQLSNGTPQRLASGFLADVVGRIDAAYAEEVNALDASFHHEYRVAVAEAAGDPDARRAAIVALDERLQLTARFEALAAFLDTHAAALAAAYPADPGIPLVARQTAASRLRLIAMGRAPSLVESAALHGEGMADNVDFLLDRLYPGRKVIVWSHNAHVMHDRASLSALGGGAVFPPSMGATIAERRRAELYTIGLFMYRGQAADSAGHVHAVTPAHANSLEAVLRRPRKMWIFVDLLHQTRSHGTSWMFDGIPGKERGTRDVRFAPREQFDGILFVDTVSPPEYYTPIIIEN